MIQLVVVALVLTLVLFPVWAIVRIISLGRENNALAQRLAEIDIELDRLRRAAATPASGTRPVSSLSHPPAEPVPPPPVAADAPSVAAAPAPSVPVAAPPLRVAPAAPPPLVPTAPPVMAAATVEGVTPLRPLTAPTVSAAAEPEPKFDWERFMGAKLFAWLGGLAAFLAAAFFVKYSFEHDLIPAQVRVAIGFLFAIGLVIAGLKIPRDRYAITAQTLIATGIVSLYGVTFACNSIYHFAFFGPIPTFLVMTLITAAAFLLAVRLDARVIAILGILGGFLTPVLLSTGHDNPGGLFGYIAILDIGLIAVGLRRGWHFLVPLGAGGTVLMQVAWAGEYLVAEKAPVAMIVCLGFSALFVASYFVARSHPTRTLASGDAAGAEAVSVPREIAWAAIGLPIVALGFAFGFLSYDPITARPGLLFTYVIAADGCLLALAWADEQLPKLHLIAGVITFALLTAWTGLALTTALLPWALVFYLAHAALHTAFPLVLERHRPAAAPTWWSQLFPPLTLLLLLGPILKLDSVSMFFWPAVLMIDLLAIGLALFTASLLGVAAVLVLTLGVTAFWLFRLPATLELEPVLLVVIGGFALFFFVATAFLSHRLRDRLAPLAASPVFGDLRSQLPAFSALLPFALLVMVTQRLPVANPSAVFGLALLLAVLVLGLAVVMTLEWLPGCALVGVAALECAWHLQRFTVGHADVAVAWYLIFFGCFAAYPFVFRRRFAALSGPWAIAALAGAVHFPLVYRVVQATWPNHVMGLLPAAFAIVPLASLVALVRGPATASPARLNQLAWFGGVALLFITLIFPIQFERQWLTLAWGLEGAALLWLYHRVPHAGLRVVGVALLVVAFVRLAANPAVLQYHVRSETPLLNWYLYSYGVVIAALFVGGRLLSAPRQSLAGIDARPLLNTLGTVLAFVLLNIEIADFFSRPGTRVLAFQFSGNFARDMSYTIGWSLFALGLLLISIARSLRPGRYAALSLLGLAVLKLFVHDLAQLDSLYRIGALVAVAMVAIGASFAYQRFLPSNEKTTKS